MGHTLTSRPRYLRAMGWTVLFVFAIFIVDRGIQGPSIKSGWIMAQKLSDVPPKAGKIIIPPYLPKAVLWPPQEILYQISPTPGLWLGCQDVWFGQGNSPLPKTLTSFAGCFDEKSRCPLGWHLLSTQLKDGRVIHLLSKIDTLETQRILEGLRL